MKLLLAMVFALLAAGAARADDRPTVAGFWESPGDDGKPQGWFLFAEKDGLYSARLVKGFMKPGEKEHPNCENCPGERKGARMMGLTIFSGLKRDGLEYTDGHVIDPRSGKTYDAVAELSEDGQTLKVTGYWKVKLAGKTMTWKRLPDDAMKSKDVPKEVLAKAGVTPALAEEPK